MPASEQARKDRIAAALAANPADRDRVSFRGKMQSLPVIRLALKDTVLNHRSHRIKAQLEGSAAEAAIAVDPESDVAQTAIRKILRATPGFEPLKQNLKDEEQREPGVVTRTGLLINGNTRAVALGDLGEEYIDVAVLPADASIPELYALEADLQVAADYRQDYTFTNELLFVHDLIEQQNRSERDVALRMRWASPSKPASVTKGIEKVRQFTRHLAFIREIQALSGKQVPLTDFDDTNQVLLEFDMRYEALRIKDPPGATKMKTAQILALLADLGYEASREIKPEWVDTHLTEAIAENQVLAEIAEGLSAAPTDAPTDDPDGLDILEDEDPEPNAETGSTEQLISSLVEGLGKSAQHEAVKFPTANGKKEFSRATVISAVRDAMKTASEGAKEEAKAGNALKAPVTYCEDATKRLLKTAQAWEKAHDDTEFDQAAFQAAFAKAERALEALKQTAGL
jgi:hypothetical protein